MKPDDVLAIYDRRAADWDRDRNRTLFERRWLDRFRAHLPRNADRLRILDLGCGTGRPIATYLAERGAEVTGVDGAPAMLDAFRAHLPDARAVQADLRGLDLGERFDGIVAWNSVFHLTAEDQRAVMPALARHAAPGAVLLMTTGDRAGEAAGDAAGEAVYHASLDPGEYRALLEAEGFEILRFVPNDPECNSHSVWLCRAATQPA